MIGLNRSAANYQVRYVPFRVFTLTAPDRRVIDMAMPGEHPWNCQSGAVRVYFFDEPRYVANTEPFYTPVWRRVRVPAVAGGALHSMFHGPLAAEHERGLRFLNSEAPASLGARPVDAHVIPQVVGPGDILPDGLLGVLLETGLEKE